LAREAHAEGIAIIGSKDGYLIGPRGKRFIDFTSGWCVGNYGWNNRSIRATIRNFKGPTYVCLGYCYEAWDELAALLGDLAPGKLTHCFRATGRQRSGDWLRPDRKVVRGQTLPFAVRHHVLGGGDHRSAQPDGHALISHSTRSRMILDQLCV
jgi:hypothetical protein